MNIRPTKQDKVYSLMLQNHSKNGLQNNGIPKFIVHKERIGENLKFEISKCSKTHIIKM